MRVRMCSGRGNRLASSMATTIDLRRRQMDKTNVEKLKMAQPVHCVFLFWQPLRKRLNLSAALIEPILRRAQTHSLLFWRLLKN